MEKTNTQSICIEEEKYDSLDTLLIPFVEPQVDDYLQCDIAIKKCSVVKRIIHVMQYQNRLQIKSHDNKQNIPLYEYITTLPNYTVPTFMEDWYHTKTQHFKQDVDYKWFKENHNPYCDHNKQCSRMNRHARERGHEIYRVYDDTDHKNIILTDIIDSIHVFIFHSINHQPVQKSGVSTIDYLLPEDQNSKPNQQIWANNPKEIQYCNCEQILHILNDANVFKNVHQLKNFKSRIINHIKKKNKPINYIRKIHFKMRNNYNQNK
eukprot:157887_1